MQPLVELDRVSFRYGSTPVLEDICLHVHPGQCAALVGPSGAGKTTLLRLILGLLEPTSGEVRIHGQRVNGQPRPQVGYVPQLETVDWNFPVTAEQVVLMGRTARAGIWPWPSREDRRRVREVLERLEIAEYAGRHIRDLSGGQQQRVFLARALMAEPDLLILDEPTAGVDMHAAENMLHMLAEFNRQGMTVLMTTHDLNLAAAHLSWVICLNRRVIAQGAPEDVFRPEVLDETYQAEMLVLRQDGMLFVQQKPHGHSYRDVVPHPVPGEVPARGSEAADGRTARAVRV